jgi:formate dehydrogenase major subunit
MFCVGQNPATSLNGTAQRAAMRRLQWLVVKDNWLTETAMYWKNAPEIVDGSVKTRIQTEIFLLPRDAGRRIRRQLHQHAADAAVAFQSR